MNRRKLKRFLDELRAVCRRYKLSLGHEDSGGAFVVEEWNPEYDAWLADAHHRERGDKGSIGFHNVMDYLLTPPDSAPAKEPPLYGYLEPGDPAPASEGGER